MALNTYQNVNAYGRNQKIHAEAQSTDNSRETDARALLTCAAKLNDGKTQLAADPQSKETMRAYNEAIRTNQRLWTIFQIALTDPQNPLPQGLKITLLRLSRYVDKTSFSAIGKYRPELIDSLINVNRMIAAGLSKKPPEQAKQPVYEDYTVPTSLSTSA